jgi:hypothetical protein
VAAPTKHNPIPDTNIGRVPYNNIGIPIPHVKNVNNPFLPIGNEYQLSLMDGNTP